MSNRFTVRLRRVVPIALALCALGAASASAATTRYAAPVGTTSASECTDPSTPCALPVALAHPVAGDTVSLAAGTYDVQGLVLPLVPLHWVATNQGARPVLTSAAPGDTVELSFPSSGSSFEGVEIDNTSTLGVALAVDPAVDATVRSTVLRAPHCVLQGDLPSEQLAGELTIEDSTLSNPVGRTCATLGPASILRRSSVSQTAGIATQTPPAAVVTQGLVEDTQISGGLQLVGAAAVARRDVASGWTGIWGQGLVVGPPRRPRPDSRRPAPPSHTAGRHTAGHQRDRVRPNGTGSRGAGGCGAPGDDGES